METTIEQARGTVTFKVNDKVEYKIKVTWQYVHEVEAKVASMTTLLNKVSMYALSQKDIALLLFHGTRTTKDAPTYEELSQLVFEEGVDGFLEGVAEIIKFSLGGSKNWKEVPEKTVAQQEQEEAEPSEKKLTSP